MESLERPYFTESVNHIIRAITGGGAGGETPVDLRGLSTDEKPTDVPKYSMFLELDTGDFYYWDGSAWQKVGGAA